MLIEQYKLAPEVAFHIYRPVLPHAFHDCVPSLPPAARSGADNAAVGSKRSGKYERKEKGEVVDDDDDNDDADDAADEQNNADKANGGDSTTAAANDGKASLLDTVRSLRSGDGAWTEISVELYTLFWSLELYDIEVPRAQYEAQQRVVSQQLRDLESNSALTGSKRRKERERLNGVASKLRAELAEQLRNNALVIKRVKAAAPTLLESLQNRHELTLQFLQQCVVPRCLFSAQDAAFCARFILLLHRVGTPLFSTLQLYDKITKELPAMIVCW